MRTVAVSPTRRTLGASRIKSSNHPSCPTCMAARARHDPTKRLLEADRFRCLVHDRGKGSVQIWDVASQKIKAARARNVKAG